MAMAIATNGASTETLKLIGTTYDTGEKPRRNTKIQMALITTRMNERAKPNANYFSCWRSIVVA